MDRRDFLKLTATTGASATLASCGNPEIKLMRFIPEEELMPGISVWKPSICPLCPSGCGVLVRVMEGDVEVTRNGQQGLMKMGLAKKLEGNPAHPISQGRLCVRGQAALQVTYHPDRIRQPLKRTGERGSGPFQPISWEEALTEVKTKLDALAAANNQKSLTFLTRPLFGQRNTLVSRFLSSFGAPQHVSFEVFGEQVLREANARSFGYDQLPTLDLARARYVITFGADMLGTWNSSVAQNVGYGEMRQGHPGQRAKFVQVEPRMSQTGANADEWVPVRPGTDGVLALGIAHVILREQLRSAANAGAAGRLIDGWAAGLPAYTPADVERITGVSASRVERLAREFAGSGPAVAVIGGAPLAHTNGMFSALAVNALNALVGSVGQPGGIYFMPKPPLQTDRNNESTASAPLSLDKLATLQLASGESPVQVLFLYDVNPVYGAPPAWRIREALSKIPYIVSFGNFIDETSILADLILPDHSFLESWVDHVPESGATVAIASVAPPAMRPLHDTRPMTDVLLEVARSLNAPLTTNLPWQTFEEMLQTSLGSLPMPSDVPPEAAGADIWTTLQQRGGWWGPAQTAATRSEQRGAAPATFAEPQFDGAEAEYTLHFLPFASQAFLDGSLAHLPWLQELPDVLSTAMWSSWVEINPQTAGSLGITQGDLVEIVSSQGSLQVPAIVSPGIAPNVIAVPAGQGHESFTRYASGRGVNPMRLIAPVLEPETGTLAWAATRVRISKVGGKGDLILFAGAMREHEIEHR